MKDELSNLPKVDLENYQNNFKNLLQFSPNNQLPKLGCRELMKKKCLNEGLTQRLVSFNEKLTNYFENGALSEFGKWRELRDFFSKVDLAIKSL